MLKEGDTAPGFTVLNDQGDEVSLSDFLGKKGVLYFYPKDNTPGCTKEACSFRADHSQFLLNGAAVLGVSPDTQTSHLKFKAKFSLPFQLLSDPDHRVAEMYGAWGEKKAYGRTYMGIIRSTFVVDETGYILKVFPKVKPAEHAKEVLAVL